MSVNLNFTLMYKSTIFIAALSATMLVGCNQNQQQDSSAAKDADTISSTPGQRLDDAIEKVEQSADRTSQLAKEEVDKAEAAMEKAKRDLADAKQRGDAKAESEAQKALNKATGIWENTKKAANRAVDATEKAARKTGQAVDTSVQRASRKVNDLFDKD